VTKEYRVVWKRKGVNRKIKKCVRKITAARHAALLTSQEPWVLFGQKPDDLACCTGHECGCGGLTIEQEYNQRSRAYPPLEYVKIEIRDVSLWVHSENCDVEVHSSTLD